MYLLNLPLLSKPTAEVRYLHSTMYLLNPDSIAPIIENIIFTFHYVSIKSSHSKAQWNHHLNLHSTMYLLNL